MKWCDRCKRYTKNDDCGPMGTAHVNPAYSTINNADGTKSEIAVYPTAHAYNANGSIKMQGKVL
jgi:hypothetical protein